jgi:predicted amidohydrolase
MTPLHITAVQLNLVWQDPAANRQRIERLLKGKRAATDLILLPEMFTTGFTMEADRHWEEMEGTTQTWMQQLAKQHKALVGGSLIIREGDDYFNRFLMVGPDGVLAEYDKRHLFRMADEHDYFEAGEEWVWFTYKGWNIVPLICYDLRFPVWSRNRPLGDRSTAYDLLLYVANWPQKRAYHWDTLLRARAIENQSYVVGVNRVGKDGNGIDYEGGSVILDPMGQELALNRGDDILLEHTLDPQLLLEYRKKFPAWQDADVFEVYP